LQLTAKLGRVLDVPLQFSQVDQTGAAWLDRNIKRNAFCLTLNRRRDICRRCALVCFQNGVDRKISAVVTRFTCICGAIKLVTPVRSDGVFHGVLVCGPILVEKADRESFMRMMEGLNHSILPEDRRKLWLCYSRIPVSRRGKVKELTSLLPRFASFLGSHTFVLPPSEIPENPATPILVDRVLQLIQRQSQNDGDAKITLKNMAQQLHVSAAHLSREFHRLVGEPFHVYVARAHIKQAEELMETSSIKCSEIAFMCGFNSVAAFNRWFHRLTGKSPREFRRRPKKKGVL